MEDSLSLRDPRSANDVIKEGRGVFFFFFLPSWCIWKSSLLEHVRNFVLSFTGGHEMQLLSASRQQRLGLIKSSTGSWPNAAGSWSSSSLASPWNSCKWWKHFRYCQGFQVQIPTGGDAESKRKGRMAEPASDTETTESGSEEGWRQEVTHAAPTDSHLHWGGEADAPKVYQWALCLLRFYPEKLNWWFRRV